MLQKSFLFLFFLFFLTLTSCYQTPVTPYEEYVAKKWEESQKVIQEQNEIQQSEFINRSHKSESYLIYSSLYFGLIGMIVILNILFFINLRNPLFLYYLGFVISVNTAIAYHEGLLYPYIKNIFFTYDFDILFHHIILIASFLYFSEFVELKKRIPKIYKVLIFIIAIQLFLFLGYFIHQNTFWIHLSNITNISIILSFWLLAFFMVKKQKSILYFILGTSLAMLTAFFHVLFNPIFIPIIGSSSNLLKISLVVESIALTYAIIKQNKHILQENELIKKRLNIYLNQLKKSQTDHKFDIENIAIKHNLTQREKEVLVELLNNQTNKQIASNLSISINTVKYHIRNVYDKLDIQNRKELSNINLPINS